MKSTQIGLTNKYFLILVLALVFFVNLVSAFSNIVNMGEDGIELRNVAGASHFYPSNWYCYGYFGSAWSEDDACACDGTRNNKVTCCDSIDGDGVWVKNLEVYNFGNSISCTPLCVPSNAVCDSANTITCGTVQTKAGSCGGVSCSVTGTMCSSGSTCISGVCSSNCAETNGGVEICDGIDNNCDLSIDENLNISTGTDVGLCQSEIKQCIGGNFSVVQNRINATVEICGNGLDDDCDGYSDNNDSECDVPVLCVDGNRENYTFVNN